MCSNIRHQNKSKRWDSLKGKRSCRKIEVMNGIWEGGWIYSHLEMQLFGARTFVFMLTFWRVPRGPIGHCWPTMFSSPPHSLGDLDCCLKTKHSKSYVNMQTGQRLCIQETKYFQKTTLRNSMYEFSKALGPVNSTYSILILVILSQI